jgi:hypothetical protein
MKRKDEEELKIIPLSEKEMETGAVASNEINPMAGVLNAISPLTRISAADGEYEPACGGPEALPEDTEPVQAPKNPGVSSTEASAVKEHDFTPVAAIFIGEIVSTILMAVVVILLRFGAVENNGSNASAEIELYLFAICYYASIFLPSIAAVVFGYFKVRRSEDRSLRSCFAICSASVVIIKLMMNLLNIFSFFGYGLLSRSVSFSAGSITSSAFSMVLNVFVIGVFLNSRKIRTFSIIALAGYLFENLTYTAVSGFLLRSYNSSLSVRAVYSTFMKIHTVVSTIHLFFPMVFVLAVCTVMAVCLIVKKTAPKTGR